MKLYIGGKKVESKTDRWINNYNPATNEVISRVPCATPEEMNAAIEAAQAAFPAWKEKSILSRQQIMFQFRDLIKKHWVRQDRGWGLRRRVGLKDRSVTRGQGNGQGRGAQRYGVAEQGVGLKDRWTPGFLSGFSMRGGGGKSALLK